MPRWLHHPRLVHAHPVHGLVQIGDRSRQAARQHPGPDHQDGQADQGDGAQRPEHGLGMAAAVVADVVPAVDDRLHQCGPGGGIVVEACRRLCSRY